MELDIQKLEEEKNELQKKLTDPQFLSDVSMVKEASQRFSKIEKILAKDAEIKRLQQERMNTEKLLYESDPSLARLAEEDLTRITRALRHREEELSNLTAIGDSKESTKKAIVEIRAGTGGQEAALFATRLFDMYTAYSKQKGWSTTILDANRTTLGGIKEIIFEIDGENTFACLQYESGVHRVQRIPETEKNGRIHTSTASVAVLPEAEETDIEIKPQDLKIDFFRVSGPGGQNVNKVETGVRITHIPTGVVVTSQESRSQQQNREHALLFLRTKLFDEKKRVEEEKMATERRRQIGNADRSEKIRTYNFPQDRVTDHRIKESWHNIESIMAGNIDEMITALTNYSDSTVAQ